MCGLVGMAGQITATDEKAFKDLLTVDAIRGVHSVGIAAVNGQGDATVYKRAIPVSDFLDLKPVEDIFRKVNRVLIGHNRAATKGRINTENAHPFEFDKVIGAHNGTLRNQTLLPDHTKFEVDSENLFYAINNNGTRQTARQIHGAFALTWWNKEDNTLHLWRNSERPLWFCKKDDDEVIYWASEPWMLIGCLGRHKIKHTDPEQLPVHNEYILSIPLSFKDGRKLDKEKVKVVPHTMYVAPPAPAKNSYKGYQSQTKKPQLPAGGTPHGVTGGSASDNLRGTMTSRSNGDPLKKPGALSASFGRANTASETALDSTSPSFPRKARPVLRMVK